MCVCVCVCEENERADKETLDREKSMPAKSRAFMRCVHVHVPQWRVIMQKASEPHVVALSFQGKYIVIL